MRAALLILLLFVVNVADAGEWPTFRGPTFDGASAESSLPERLDWRPVAGGRSQRVVVLFGSGDIAAYSHAGTKLWQRNLQKALIA